MESLKISVVMPVYNAGKYLAEAIESILNQTFSKFEFIVIDDGSSDESLAILKRYARSDSRIRLISRPNRGLVATLNEGFALAKGEFIARMDADDISLPNRFSYQVRQLEDDDADLCGCHYYVIDEEGQYLDAAITPLTQQSAAVFLSNTTPFAHGSVMIRRSTLERLQCFYGMTGVKAAEDYALWIELYNSNARFTNVDDFLFKYRDFSTSLSKKNRNHIKGDAKGLVNKFVLDHKDLLISMVERCARERVSNREQEILVIALLRVIWLSKDVKIIRNFSSFSKRNLLCGLLRFLSRSV